MFEPSETRRRGAIRYRRQDQNRGIARSFAPKESKFTVLTQHTELVSRELRQGDLLTVSN
jgi:hypothetical protein